LAHFYIHHSGSSARELHPFTTTTSLASQHAVTDPARDDIDIQFLFRKRGITATIPKPELKTGFIPIFMTRLRHGGHSTQWTNKLAGFAQDEDASRSSMTTNRDSDTYVPGKGLPVSIRLEGPYFTPAETYRYNTVVCIVAGTGISGALAIAGAFKELEKQSTSNTVSTNSNNILAISKEGSLETKSEMERKSSFTSNNGTHRWTRCIIIWSVREDHYIELPELESKFYLIELRSEN
jgi:hypothetical protein